jgi:diguanylate cyclase
MRYSDSHERSGELLRLTLPLMSKHASAFHPVSYAIWYEHVSRRTPALTDDLTGVTTRGSKLSEEDTYRLYQQYVVEAAEKNIARANGEFDRVMGDVTGSMAVAQSKTNAYASSLHSFESELATDGLNGSAVHQRIQTVLRDTKETSASIDVLCHLLEDSRQEITKLRDELARSRDEALHDPLTLIANRRAFVDALETFTADALKQNSELSLLLLDIDHFKNINDTYGHLFGDRVLRSVAKMLQSTVKGRDVAARYGGEEFAILLPATPIKGAVALAESIRTAMQKLQFKRADNQAIIEGITISIGASIYRPNEPLPQFVNRADEALYASKRAGRNRVTAM